MSPRVATFLALHWSIAGCGESTSAEQSEGTAGCGYEDREVSLDARFGDETPGEVIELLKRAVDGRVTWYGGSGMHVDVGGVSGQTEFHAQVSFAGPTVWVREGIEGKGGILEDRLFCPTHLLFDVAVQIETEDGALAETWNGRADYQVSGTLGGIGGITVNVDDPRPFAGSLTVTEHADVPEQWETHELAITMVFVTYPLDVLGMNGAIRYDLSNFGDGGGDGVVVTVGEFSRVE
jgi:hypothetical protein